MKYIASGLEGGTLTVALLVRAWIEILTLKVIHTNLIVALLVRAWIEIISDEGRGYDFESPSS